MLVGEGYLLWLLLMPPLAAPLDLGLARFKNQCLFAREGRRIEGKVDLILRHLCM